ASRTGERCSTATGPAAPPENASAGRPYVASSSGSALRTLRTGPTTAGCRLAKTAASRVRPASTCSTYTRSADSSPICGRPLAVSSILTTTTGCFGTPRRPVSGFTAGGGFGLGVGVGVGDGVGLGVGLAVVGLGAAACSPPLEQPA